MNLKNHVITCQNCGYKSKLTPSILKDAEWKPETYPDPIFITYTECPVCGEREVQQVDTPYTKDLSRSVAKLQIRKHQCKKLSDKQKTRLSKLNYKLDNIRKVLNELFWDESYQFLNK